MNPKTALALVAGFYLFLGILVALDRAPASLLGLYLLTSIVAFAVYAQDKSAAKKGRYRIPEATLHLWSLIGGWPGGLLGQAILRHKSQKTSFQALFWLTVIVNIALLGVFLGMR